MARQVKTSRFVPGPCLSGWLLMTTKIVTYCGAAIVMSKICTNMKKPAMSQGNCVFIFKINGAI